MSSLAIIALSRPRERKTGCRQAVSGPVIRVSPRPGDGTKGLLRVGHLVLPCALGRSGIGILKREGDGRTPRAEMRILFGMAAARHWPAAWRRPWLVAGKEPLGWCDDSGHANYNRAVRLPFLRSHETLARDDRLYDCVVVLDWNMGRRARKRGSAIFIHVARDGLEPTEGCIALAARDLARLIRLVGPGSRLTTA